MTSHDSAHLVVCHIQGEPGSSGDRGDGGRKGPPGDQVCVVTLHVIYLHEPKHFDILTLLCYPSSPPHSPHTHATHIQGPPGGSGVRGPPGPPGRAGLPGAPVSHCCFHYKLPSRQTSTHAPTPYIFVLA